MLNKAVQDAAQGNWVDLYAPSFAQPYLRLARADRPIGSWLLFLPCLWSVLLAVMAVQSGVVQPHLDVTMWAGLWLVLLFAIGSIAMRGAGCTYNDIIDRDIDAQVARTKSRPIPSGQTSIKQAVLFLLAQCLVGLAVLLQLNGFSIALGISSLLIVLVYPFMKRITYWPQLVLGGAFAWGSLMGWAAMTGSLSVPPILLYLGTIVWIIGYDTIYAHQDVEDDALLGLKSTALNFGSKTQKWLVLFYSLTFILICVSGYSAGANVFFFLGMIVAGLQLIWQVKGLDIHDSDDCLRRFKSNKLFGLMVSFAFGIDILSVYL